jgi:hypothetical protein
VTARQGRFDNPCLINLCFVFPAKAGTHAAASQSSARWVPAFAGMAPMDRVAITPLMDDFQ